MRKVFFDDKIEDEFYKSVARKLFSLPLVSSSVLLTSPFSFLLFFLRNYLYGFGNTKQLAQTAAGRLQIGSK